MKIRVFASAVAISISSLALSGCGIAVQSNSENHLSHETGTSFSSADIMFAQMMIPHHLQAVDMGTLAETRALNPEVRALAEQIKTEQAPEIQQMKAWLTKSGAGLDMGHDMGMDGMLTDSELEALKSATGNDFDKLYLIGMIGHHEGAIKMAKVVLNSKNAQVSSLAEAIIASQTKQITYMKELLKSLG
jgi:uncharacterized protein (DUF305 family)